MLLKSNNPLWLLYSTDGVVGDVGRINGVSAEVDACYDSGAEYGVVDSCLERNSIYLPTHHTCPRSM